MPLMTFMPLEDEGWMLYVPSFSPSLCLLSFPKTFPKTSPKTCSRNFGGCETSTATWVFATLDFPKNLFSQKLKWPMFCANDGPTLSFSSPPFFPVFGEPSKPRCFCGLKTRKICTFFVLDELSCKIPLFLPIFGVI